MPTGRAAIDTGALLALASPRDQHHADAVSVARRHLETGGRWVGSVLVLAELHGHLLRWREPRVAHALIDRVRADPAYDWRGVDGALIEAATVNWLLRHADLRLSLPDAVTCELMRQERLDTVFAFDRNFVTVGYRLQG
jgi:predicted nucleic acid-binding protein